ncbi:MAG TPA: hypothetical protein DDZ70_04845, partial [Firmicutes bacterium]|nr:hypothetical protein [Bacillota bacterium]
PAPTPAPTPPPAPTPAPTPVAKVRYYEVRPLAQKIELFASLTEIYQANVTHYDLWRDVYLNEYEDNQAAQRHYQWLMKTYDGFDARMRDDLNYFFSEANAWHYIDLLLGLEDSTTVSNIITYLLQLTDARLADNLGGIAEESGFKPRLANFLRRYYNSFFAAYFRELYTRSLEQAAKLNASANFNIIEFMERETAIKFAGSTPVKTVFYLTSAFMGSMGFERQDQYICLLQADTSNLASMLATAFHEIGHTLFRTYITSRDFGIKVEQVLDDPELAQAQLEFSDAYGRRAFVEENLVDGCSLYLLYRHGDISMQWLERIPVYTEFEREYIIGLVTEFQPAWETIFQFTNKFLDRKIIQLQWQ